MDRVMKKIIINTAQIGDKIKVPIDDSGNFTYDYDGRYLTKGQYIIATVIGTGIIAWKEDQKVKVLQGFSIGKILGSSYEEKYPKLDKYVNLSGGVPCIVIPAKQKPAVKFLFASLAAGAAMNSLFRTSGNRAVDSKMREISK